MRYVQPVNFPWLVVKCWQSALTHRIMSQHTHYKKKNHYQFQRATLPGSVQTPMITFATVAPAHCVGPVVLLLSNETTLCLLIHAMSINASLGSI